MNARSLPNPFRGFGRNSLDLPVAGLAALATFYVAFAAPGELLASVVGSTGLPDLVPAAGPPLGNRARFGLGLAGAITIFLLVLGLLRLLDRKTGLHRKAEQLDDQLPRLRRRDVHPDAPARRPISASLEFGEPAAPIGSASSPPWLSPADSVLSDPQIDEPGDRDFGEISFEPEVEPAAAGPEPAQSRDEDPAPLPFTAAEGKPAESIHDLMARLELGLARRQTRPEPQSAPAPSAPVASREPATGKLVEEVPDRLQSAIESLQRLAGRQV